MSNFTKRSRLPEPVFAVNPFLGNIGAPLRDLEEDEQEEMIDLDIFAESNDQLPAVLKLAQVADVEEVEFEQTSMSI